jgi:adenine phosphoribosyltransferase
MAGVIGGDGLSEFVTQGEGIIDHAGIGVIPHRRWRNHPRQGVDFPDFSTAGASPELHVAAIDALSDRLASGTQMIAGLDIGGATLAGAVSYRRRIGSVDIRKVDSIRPEVIRSILRNYELGEGMAISKGIELAGRRVALVDDCLMTGTAALASIRLLRRLGAICTEALFIFDLIGMGGREQLEAEGVEAHVLQSLPMNLSSVLRQAVPG